eukprot:289714-Prorocentrum_minimum.AAC.1
MPAKTYNFTRMPSPLEPLNLPAGTTAVAAVDKVRGSEPSTPPLHPLYTPSTHPLHTLCTPSTPQYGRTSF